MKTSVFLGKLLRSTGMLFLFCICGIALFARVGKGTLMRLNERIKLVDSIVDPKEKARATRQLAAFVKKVEGQLQRADLSLPADQRVFTKIQQKLASLKAKFTKAPPVAIGRPTLPPGYAPTLPRTGLTLRALDDYAHQVIANTQRGKLKKNKDSFLRLGLVYDSPEHMWGEHKDRDYAGDMIKAHTKIARKLPGKVRELFKGDDRTSISSVLTGANLDSQMVNEMSFWALTELLEHQRDDVSDEEVMQAAGIMFVNDVNRVKKERVADEIEKVQVQVDEKKAALGRHLEQAEREKLDHADNFYAQAVEAAGGNLQDNNVINAEAVFTSARESVSANKSPEVAQLIRDFARIRKNLTKLKAESAALAKDDEAFEPLLQNLGYGVERDPRRTRDEEFVKPKSNKFKYFIGVLLAASLGIGSLALYSKVSEIRKESETKEDGTKMSWSDALTQARKDVTEKITWENIKDSPFALFRKLKSLVTGKSDEEVATESEEEKVPEKGAEEVGEGEGEVEAAAAGEEEAEGGVAEETAEEVAVEGEEEAEGGVGGEEAAVVEAEEEPAVEGAAGGVGARAGAEGEEVAAKGKGKKKRKRSLGAIARKKLLEQEAALAAQL